LGEEEYIIKISSKGRYAIAAMVDMAQIASLQDRVTVLSLSQRLDISKIFLEQVFSLLRRGGLVTSIKGSQGGYQLARPASEITACDILYATETALFEAPESTVESSSPGIEKAMQRLIFSPAEKAFAKALKSVTLSELAEDAQQWSAHGDYMYYL
jgi:Rrf2 family protein